MPTKKTSVKKKVPAKKELEKRPRVRIERVISAEQRQSYTPAYELEPHPSSGHIGAQDLPVGTVLEVVSIPKPKDQK